MLNLKEGYPVNQNENVDLYSNKHLSALCELKDIGAQIDPNSLLKAVSQKLNEVRSNMEYCYDATYLLSRFYEDQFRKHQEAFSKEIFDEIVKSQSSNKGFDPKKFSARRAQGGLHTGSKRLLLKNRKTNVTGFCYVDDKGKQVRFSTKNDRSSKGLLRGNEQNLSDIKNKCNHDFEKETASLYLKIFNELRGASSILRKHQKELSVLEKNLKNRLSDYDGEMIPYEQKLQKGQPEQISSLLNLEGRDPIPYSKIDSIIKSEKPHEKN